MHESNNEALTPHQRLRLVEPRRMVLQRERTSGGAETVSLYYGEKEVVFDEPHLFVFAETLASQSSFLAGAAVSWGDDLAWPEVAGLLSALVQAGILIHDDGVESRSEGSRMRPSPLPQAKAKTIRTLVDSCSAITLELSGRAVDVAWLELIVPVFRVAHPALDADGRQVGEANVFPRPLRVDTKTEWMSCPFPGTRYNSERPMNTTALKAMRAHWTQMMGALRLIRARFLKRFPEAEGNWTLAHVERLATLVLAVPTWQLVKAGATAAPLHPALSSLFRVTDGLRMATHQMMFVPVGEPALPPSTPVDARMIFDYAERNYSFHSDTGVCAGPAHMVLEFIETLLHGEVDSTVVFEPGVAAALAEIEPAMDYGLDALRAHAALFCFWPAMARAYEAIAEISADAVSDGHHNFSSLSTRFGGHLATIRRVTLLGSEEWRQGREAAYAEIFDSIGRGSPVPGPSFAARTAAAGSLSDLRTGASIAAVLRRRLGGSQHTLALATAIAQFAEMTRRLLVVATDVQLALSRRLDRPAPTRPFVAADIGVHSHLLGTALQRLPFLFDELEAALGLSLHIEAGRTNVAVSIPTQQSAANTGR